ncbi:hypothetical protein DES53_106298 [Roseimicrobium gellanilyticum]|uniref:GDSL-like lipase/acylhydrolase family protein n=1 Tax=Roseimicrobium gellanilyticum TaxID=748857 RepID=A0A366HKN5_9BACT|nr:SGNH/GDSL hydrolase family protein [Roseimicrobium gellanilyticum]RBP42589.1 hypothetical protein DES53_106298 [Roseimicrobium gellanilyticum]
MRLSASLLFCSLVLLLIPSCNERQQAQKPEIRVEVERVAASKAKTPEDVRPYDEALTWHEYKVKRVLSGKLEAPVIRVAHWSVIAAKSVPVSDKQGEEVTLQVVPFDSVEDIKDIAASDDLEITAEEPPRFLDLSQSLAQQSTPSVVRLDYRGNVSDQMQIYWKVRGQLQAVVMGNSHATKGVCPREFFGQENWSTPVMLNLAPAGGNNKLQCLMIREYVEPLPKLKWVMWVVSARTFNKERTDERKYEEFTASPGWQYDQKHKATLWPVPASDKVVSATELEALNITGCDEWGWEGRKQTNLPKSLEEQRKQILQLCDSERFAWSEDIFAEFKATAQQLAKKGVKVLLFTTPLHPYTKDAAASDPDGTTHEGFREVVQHMQKLDAETPGLWFQDFHKDGVHDFPPDEFYDVDHLNRKGTARLAEKIRPWMEECEKEVAASR